MKQHLSVGLIALLILGIFLVIAPVNASPVWTQQNPSAGWSARYFHSSVAMPDGSIVLMGGTGDNWYNDVWLSTDKGVTWTPQTTSAGAEWSPRYIHSSVAMPDGKSIVLMGGYDNNNDIYRNDTWWSTDKGITWTQQTVSAEWSARGSHTSVAMPDGSIVLMGGAGSGYSRKNDVWLSIDKGAHWTLQTASAGLTARMGASSVVMPDGKSIVLMGGNPNGPLLNDVWLSIDKGATWTSQTTNAEWSARTDFSSVAMADGSIVLMGGFDGNNLMNDVWRSTDSGKTWTQSPNAGWSAREYFSSVAMADGSIVLTGGYDSMTAWSPKNDVWRLPAGSSGTKATISSISDKEGDRGWIDTITIKGLNFKTGAVVKLVDTTKTGTDIIGTTTGVSSDGKSLTVKFDLKGAIPYGSPARHVTVTNLGADTADNPKVTYLILSDAPKLSEFTPSSGARGKTVTFTKIAGDNFQPGATVKLTRDGTPDITVGVTVVSPTKITGTITIPATAKTGSYAARITNTDGKTVKRDSAFKVT